jgi:sucrose-6-phosphate hydrolase SacC (GH32 family)
MIFSGSAVADVANDSGFGRPDVPALVAVYTGAGQGRQTQNLAYSLDRGRTWTKFAANPVLDLGSNSFRDPKVFWHAPTHRWVMVTVLADERKVRLWRSADLRRWERLSDFGPSGSTAGVWECPELFEAPVEGEASQRRWVLKVDVNDGAPAGGSGGQYFVGQFDGETFRPELGGAGGEPLWIDQGKDFYLD